MNVTDTIVRWMCQKILLIHDAPDGFLELRVDTVQRVRRGRYIVTHQCQTNANLPLENLKPRQHRLFRSFAQGGSLDDQLRTHLTFADGGTNHPMGRDHGLVDVSTSAERAVYSDTRVPCTQQQTLAPIQKHRKRRWQ